MPKTTAEKYHTRRALVQSLRGAEAEWSKLMSAPKCDKKGFGFNKGDDRFAALKLTVTLESWKGWYGDSSCSTWLSIPDREIAGQALIAYLNAHRPQILAWMADHIEQESEAQKQAYMAELEAELSKLKGNA